MHPLDAISEPRRREIVGRIAELGEVAVGDLASTMDVSRPAVSQHLKVLLDAGIVTERRDGRRRLYRIDPAGLDLARATLEAFLVDRLDDVETAARRFARMAPHPARSEDLPHG